MEAWVTYNSFWSSGVSYNTTDGVSLVNSQTKKWTDLGPAYALSLTTAQWGLRPLPGNLHAINGSWSDFVSGNRTDSSGGLPYNCSSPFLDFATDIKNPQDYSLLTAKSNVCVSHQGCGSGCVLLIEGIGRTHTAKGVSITSLAYGLSALLGLFGGLAAAALSYHAMRKFLGLKPKEKKGEQSHRLSMPDVGQLYSGQRRAQRESRPEVADVTDEPEGNPQLTHNVAHVNNLMRKLFKLEIGNVIGQAMARSKDNQQRKEQLRVRNALLAEVYRFVDGWAADPSGWTKEEYDALMKVKVMLDKRRGRPQLNGSASTLSRSTSAAGQSVQGTFNGYEPSIAESSGAGSRRPASFAAVNRSPSVASRPMSGVQNGLGYPSPQAVPPQSVPTHGVPYRGGPDQGSQYQGSQYQGYQGYQNHQGYQGQQGQQGHQGYLGSQYQVPMQPGGYDQNSTHRGFPPGTHPGAVPEGFNGGHGPHRTPSLTLPYQFQPASPRLPQTPEEPAPSRPQEAQLASPPPRVVPPMSSRFQRSAHASYQFMTGPSNGVGSPTEGSPTDGLPTQGTQPGRPAPR